MSATTTPARDDFASPGGPSRQGEAMPTMQGRHVRRGRPKVLEAGRTAMVPLRPLTIMEILDAAFVVIRSRPKAMLGLPLLLSLAMVAFAGLNTVGIMLLGESTSPVVVVLLSVLGIMGATLVLLVAIIWLNAVLSRIALEVLLGPGFVPVIGKLRLRNMIRWLPAVIGLALLQAVGTWLVQSVAGVLSYVFIPLTMVPDPALQWIGAVVVSLVIVLVTCWGYSYIALAVPAYMVENGHTPAWVGRPYQPTNVFTAFARSIRLIGMRQAVRSTLVLAGSLLLCMIVLYLTFYGFIVLTLSLLQNFTGAAMLILGNNPLILLGIFGASMIISGSVCLAFFAASQTVLYLDLRMRREGLDLALRFDQVEIPQPSTPPVAPRPMVPTGPPPGPPRGPAPTPGPPPTGGDR
ncbi:hypothetical protein [Microlunatus sp. Y2014]|uniref:hypothetical protein n=1 Tax=Microlunatus sp. Y2014 TaxID=3418488 RepID=UPI003DA72E5E